MLAVGKTSGEPLAVHLEPACVVRLPAATGEESGPVQHDAVFAGDEVSVPGDLPDRPSLQVERFQEAGLARLQAGQAPGDEGGGVTKGLAGVVGRRGFDEREHQTGDQQTLHDPTS